MNWTALRSSLLTNSSDWPKFILGALLLCPLAGVVMSYSGRTVEAPKWEIVAGTAAFLFMHALAAYLGTVAYSVGREISGKKRVGVLAFVAVAVSVGLTGVLAVQSLSGDRWSWVGSGSRGGGHFDVKQ